MYGIKLKEYRKNAGLSQKEVSDEMGYKTAQFISNWERGLSFPPIVELKKLAQIYKCDTKKFANSIKEEMLDSYKKSLEDKFKKLMN